MTIRTDLAAEAVMQAEDISLGGVSTQVVVNEQAALEIQRIRVFTQEAAKALGKPVGRYVTVRLTDGMIDAYSEQAKLRTKLIAREIKALCGGKGGVLVAGLGNRDITPDAVGPLCADRVFATRHIAQLAGEIDMDGLSEVCVIQTGVLGRTGIESSDMVKAVCERVSAKTVIAVDALACAETDNLGRTIQLTDTGISPGSGVANARRELSARTLGAECVAVGVPTVIDYGAQGEVMMVTPRNVDKLVQNAAEYIAMAINLALHPQLTYDELMSLV